MTPTMLLDPIDELTRRRLLGGAGALGVLTALSGCGSEPEGSPSTTGAGPFPITLEHSLGATTIERRPERTVALGVSDADIALALGVIPAGIHSLYGFDRGVGPWAHDELAGASPTVWKGRSYNFEAVAASRPDLILYVSSAGDPNEYDILTRIAPTVGLPTGAVPYAAPWRDATRLIARSVGFAAEGDRLVQEVDDYIAGLAASNPSFHGKTITYLDVFGAEIYAGGRESTVLDTMLGLGFEPVPHIRDLQPSQSQNVISAELVTQVDADVVLIYSFGKSESEVFDVNPTLKGLAAVQSGRAYFLKDLSLSAPSVLSIPYGIDSILRFLQQATTQ